MRFRAVVFDLFGTLVEGFSTAHVDEMFGQAARGLGVPGARFRRVWRECMPMRATGKFPPGDSTLRHVCSELGAEPSREQLDRAVAFRVDYFRTRMVPREGAVRTLERLREEGVKPGLLSDATWEPVMLWPETELAPLMDEAVFSCEVGLKKPDPEIYKLVCGRLGVEPRGCLFVGDGGSGELTGAQAVGMTPVRIRAPVPGEGKAFQLEPDDWEGTTISSIPEVLDLVLDRDGR